MQKFRLDWNYHSNAIEGNTLTLGETKAFLMEGLTASGKPLKDHLDIKGHNELIDFLQLFIQRQERLTEAAIREMHKILLREPYETEAETLDGRRVKRLVRLGEYKSTPNFVRTGSDQIHQYATPEDVAPKMAELVGWQREQEQKAELHPVVQAALFHHRFLAIHPFDDGNGRLGRILMNLLVMRSGFPPVVVKLSERDPYVAALRKADAGELRGITEFISQSVLDSESLYLRGAKGASIEDADDVDKAVALLKHELRGQTHKLDFRQAQIETVRNSLMPLFRACSQKLTQFDDLFRANKSSISILRTNSVSSRSVDKAYADQVLLKLADDQAPFSGIKLDFQWEAFQSPPTGVMPFDLTATLAVKFENRTFELRRSGSDQADLKRQLGNVISSEEIAAFARDLAKSVLSEIRDRIGS
jgi:Fic family protein